MFVLRFPLILRGSLRKPLFRIIFEENGVSHPALVFAPHFHSVSASHKDNILFPQECHSV